jgi:hypothetical protein
LYIFFINNKPKLNLMKMTRISRGFPAFMVSSVLRSLGSSVLMVLFLSVLAIGTAQAQSTNDWVGNRQLVNGNDAIVRLKTAARSTMQQANQQQPNSSSTAVANGLGTDLHFMLRVAEEIAANNRNSKDAINAVAIAMATEGMPATEISRVTQSIIAILS